MPNPACSNTPRGGENSFATLVGQGLRVLPQQPARTFISPPHCPRRASVALILRFRPHLHDLPALTRQSQSYASLYADGKVPLVSAEAERMNRVWSGRLSPVLEEEQEQGQGQVQDPDGSITALPTSSSSTATYSSESGSDLDERRRASTASDDQDEDDDASHAEEQTNPHSSALLSKGQPTALHSFLAQDWIQRAEPEVLYIQRAKRPGDRWSAHVAFPGGKRELEDQSDLFAAMRECWEEVGLDLSEDDFSLAGRLDDREISGNFGQRLLMILASFSTSNTFDTT